MVRKEIWEAARDDGLAHELPVGGDGDEILETLGRVCEGIADVGDADFAANGC